MRKTLVITVCALSAVLAFAYSGIAKDLVARFIPDPSHETADAAKGVLRTGADLEHAFELVDEVMQPSVVAIASTKTLASHPGFPDGQGEIPPFFRSPFPPTFPPGGLKQQGLGSGVIVSKDGFILTNNHVVQGADVIQVHLADKRSFKGRVIGTDPRTDVAVVRIDATDLYAATLADSDKVKVGQWVAAFGSPFGLERTMTSGIISAKGRANVGIVDYEDFIQTDAAINQGNSGGPLVNLKGEVIGINTAVFKNGNGAAGIGFAIPTNLAKSVMQRLMTDGKMVRGWLGVLIQDLTPEAVETLGLENAKGVLVSEVTSRSPAQLAGLESGDLLLRLDGAEVSDVNTFRNRIAGLSPGHRVKVQVRRAGADRELEVTVGELPSQADLLARNAPRTQPPADLQTGLHFSDLTPALRREHEIDAAVQGALITSVDPGSLADDAGIEPGDVLVAVARTPIAAANEAEQSLRHSDLRRGIPLRIQTADTTRYIFLRASR